MGPSRVVEAEVAVEFNSQMVAVGEVAQVNQFVLDRTPQPFDEHVVERPATAIHADGDLPLLQGSQEVGCREL